MRIQKLGLTFAVLVLALFVASGNALAGVTNGKGATTSHLVTSYPSVGGNWACSETRVVSKSYPNGKDTFTCTISAWDPTALPACSYKLVSGGPPPPFFYAWYSDFTGIQAIS